MKIKIGNEAIMPVTDENLNEFKKHLRNYKVSSVKDVQQNFIDCAFDLFCMNERQRSHIKNLEKKIKGLENEPNHQQ